MTGAEVDDLTDGEPLDDYDSRYDGDDWDPDRCDDCALYGECQCSRHAEAYLAMCAADDEHQRVAEALRMLLSAPSAHDSAAWWALRAKAREVLAEMGETTEVAS